MMKQVPMPNDAPHGGISMHKIRVGAGVAGSTIVGGFLAIGLTGVPLFRYFLVLAIAVGVGIAFGLYWFRRWQ
jgi:hypothetical protein